MSVRSKHTGLASLVAVVPGLVLASTTAAGQARSDHDAWNAPPTLELMERGRARRLAPLSDSALNSYRAEARGYVYFFVDRSDADEHILVKADQIALDLYWRAPDEAKQVIVGQRDERILPTAIRYHLDHLTVVQDDFGAFIRLGDGDEVEEVPHPVGPGSAAIYDFRLVDSLSITYSVGEEVRVYELQVRPKRMDRPGFVGTVFLDQASAAIVRMNFSFTPASYVDAQLDYIRISLDNALWMGRYWLPYRQEVELRREMPVLDFSVGSVIRSRFTIGGYDFDTVLADALFRGPAVSAASLTQRAAFPFERGLLDDVEEEGLSLSGSLEDVRIQVREVVQEEVLSGLSPIRLHLDGVSDFARYNRAEGVFVGGGLTLRPRGDTQVRASAGYAFHRRRPSASLAVSGGNRLTPSLAAYWDRIGDVGGNPGASPLVNTISAASGSKDFLDPYFRRGATLTLGSARSTVGLRWERHASARDVVSDPGDSKFRTVLSIHDGTLAALDLGTELGLPGDGRARLGASVGRLADRTLLSGTGEAEWSFGAERENAHGRVSAKGGVTNPGAPAQAMFLLGGRHTLPGQPYRAYAGNAYWLLRVEATIPVRPPYVGLRTFGAVGGTRLDALALPADWSLTSSGGPRASLGLGLSIGWDTVYLDVAHGIRGGGWEAVFSISEQFEGWM